VAEESAAGGRGAKTAGEQYQGDPRRGEEHHREKQACAMGHHGVMGAGK
jgi:hypothetical protein